MVVRGTAEVTRGSEVFLITENQSTFIPLGEIHRLHNPGKTALEMIEVQSGAYLEEDDIVRYEDQYGRVVPIKVKKMGSIRRGGTAFRHEVEAGPTLRRQPQAPIVRIDPAVRHIGQGNSGKKRCTNPTVEQTEMAYSV